jgi:hypothetical protein
MRGLTDAQVVADDVTPARARCRDCRYPQTWADQRRQWGRGLRAGLTPDEAKAAMPRCQKCMTTHLASRLAYDLVVAESAAGDGMLG